MLKCGQQAPSFQLPDETGNLTSLNDLLSSGSVILYFYPADFTYICTKQACALRDFQSQLNEVKIVGISPQSQGSHSDFISQHKLTFKLLCDEQKQVIKAFGVNGPFGLGVRRATFLINKDRTIMQRVVSDIFLARHLDLVKNAESMRLT